MYEIAEKTMLNPTVAKMVVKAPLIAKKAEPGQFIILRATENGERIPLTIADYDRENGNVTIIFQIVGRATMELNALNKGDFIPDFVGPLGTPSEVGHQKKVCVVGGGVGCAIAYPVAKKLHNCGCEVHTVAGFRNKELVILEKEWWSDRDEHRPQTHCTACRATALPRHQFRYHCRIRCPWCHRPLRGHAGYRYPA